MKTRLITLSTGMLLLSTMAMAQSPSVLPNAASKNKLAWDQAATTLAEAQSFVYTMYIDGAPTGQPIVAPVSCVNPGTAGQPFVCQTTFPALVPGQHSITLTASNGSGESTPSTALVFNFIVVPVAPKNLRVS